MALIWDGYGAYIFNLFNQDNTMQAEQSTSCRLMKSFSFCHRGFVEEEMTISTIVNSLVNSSFYFIDSYKQSGDHITIVNITPIINYHASFYGMNAFDFYI